MAVFTKTIEIEGNEFLFEVYSSMYVDWGLHIAVKKDEEWITLYNVPHALSIETYGFTWEDEDGELLDEGREWTEDEWEDCFNEHECWELLDAYVMDEDIEKALADGIATVRKHVCTECGSDNVTVHVLLNPNTGEWRGQPEDPHCENCDLPTTLKIRKEYSD